MFSGGTREGEISRTAEMVVDLALAGKVDQAIWLIFDSNRFDENSMKYLAMCVQDIMNYKRKDGIVKVG